MAIGCESAVTGAAGSDAEETLESKDISLVVPGFAASAARSKSVGISKTATAAVANILKLNLIVVS
jgi:hypothetical protein